MTLCFSVGGKPVVTVVRKVCECIFSLWGAVDRKADKLLVRKVLKSDTKKKK